MCKYTYTYLHIIHSINSKRCIETYQSPDHTKELIKTLNRVVKEIVWIQTVFLPWPETLLCPTIALFCAGFACPLFWSPYQILHCLSTFYWLKPLSNQSVDQFPVLDTCLTTNRWERLCGVVGPCLASVLCASGLLFPGAGVGGEVSSLASLVLCQYPGRGRNILSTFLMGSITSCLEYGLKIDFPLCKHSTLPI